jgi:DNA processing protein
MSGGAREQAAVLALVKASPGEWHRTAALIAEAGSAARLLAGDPGFLAADRRGYAGDLAARVSDGDLARAGELIEQAAAAGARLVTVLDENYPASLSLVYNRPPFIWVRGRLDPTDLRAVAVVGTREATSQGLAAAADFARGLAEAGVTVVSGLARGIDTAAHEAALAAGGSTVAVIGTGILAPAYPAENAGLARRIADGGALVSQFWPQAPPRRGNFPLRNVVMSGLAAGTLVVEASATSGAKLQARLALEHGKLLFLPAPLAGQQEWAAGYAGRPGAMVISGVPDVLARLERLTVTARQLPLEF